MEYNFKEIEEKWQQIWKEKNTYRVENDVDKPKYYVLDMFPYPSGAGLHVGHPLGYIASDIFARYKRLKGFNVLHPMGYDAFGLPAEQYAIEHGIHPNESTKNNIRNFRDQLDKIGFSFDWSREINTSDPSYYKWTQWIFLQLFNSFYNRQTDKAEPVGILINSFSESGNKYHPLPNAQYPVQEFSAQEWRKFDEFQQQDILMQYRLVYCGFGEVNWCEALGTVLANDEVINGYSERGGYPVVKKKLRQWYLRITEYADRLQEDLQKVDFSHAMKEMQTNWIGKSTGAEIDFRILDKKEKVKVYTTRPDTIFGVDFLVLSPEHELISELTTADQAQKVEEYLQYVKSRSDRERMAEKNVTGCFTGAYAINPLDVREVPVYVSEYVLPGYGTGAIMAVPCGDERDFRFARHFDIPITNILGKCFTGEAANPTDQVELVNSDFVTGMQMKDAAEAVITALEGFGAGKRKINYKMRDAAFSRQRYWGEPIPIIWKDGIAQAVDESKLPLELPYLATIKPGKNAESPLSSLKDWIEPADHPGYTREANTMPGYAGSSWYFLRYMDPHNEKEFCDRTISDYWNQVDLYIGGTEHAVGHLLYSRMWTKFLFDRGWIGFDEPYKKLLNQGMIQGSSRFVYRLTGTNTFISHGLIDKEGRKTPGRYTLSEVDPIRVDVNIVNGVELDIQAFRQLRSDYANADFIFENGNASKEGGQGVYLCGTEVEKMSKSKFNTVNPNYLIEKYGADTFRMYEMFLGPIEQSKPWDTKGIEGVNRFLKKLWRLFYHESGKIWKDETPTDAEWKVLHKTIKKIQDDTERFSFNTAVSAFMVCVNELNELKCHKKAILQPLAVMLSPYAPFISAELYHNMQTETGANAVAVEDEAKFPQYDPHYLKESVKLYPVSINGKMRTNIEIASDASEKEAEAIVLENETVQKWMDNKPLKKFIFIKGKMINVVV